MLDIGILGGGISGLALANCLQRRAEVLEAADRPGGLARTFGKDGYSSDIGGHILFSKDQEVLSHMVGLLGDNVARRRRNNRILYRGIHVKYPFENGLGALSKEEACECLLGFVANTNPPGPHADFEAWMRFTLGDAITDKYLLPYNRKIWKREPRDMGVEWVERVPRPPLEDVVKSALGIETEGYVHQLYFNYPKEGGIESLVRALEARVRSRQSLVTSYRVQRVEQTADGFVVNGERKYRRIVSTMPILPFLEALEGVPGAVLEAARSLAYNSLKVVLLGIGRREGLDEMTALYVPDPSVLAHRICFNCAFSETMAPAGCASVSCEITTNPGDGVFEMTDDALALRVRADLVRIGILREEDEVRASCVHAERYAYVVYDKGYAARVAEITGYLAGRGIHAAGRFAEFKYVNMDACVRRAMDLARELDRAGN